MNRKKPGSDIMNENNIVKALKYKCLSGNPLTADIVISVGRGVRDICRFKKILKLADRLEAQVVGTRAILDFGWILKDREVGLSGLRISPEICITLGVSGANFHTMGITGSKYIISVNNDSKANIFNMADYCVIEDVGSVIDNLLIAISRKRFDNIPDVKDFLLRYFYKYKIRCRCLQQTTK